MFKEGDADGIRLILVRHTESVANAQGIYQGQTYDTGLTQRGKRQAELVAKRLGNFKIDLIYTSLLQRTKETAKIIAKRCKVEVLVDRNLVEICHGKWEGQTIKWVKRKYPDLYRVWKIRPAEVQMPAGENCYQVLERIKKFLNKIRRHKREILVVTHDLVLRLMIAHLLEMPLDNIWRMKLNNGAINIIELGSQPRVILLNDTNHLRKEKADVDGQAL